MRAVLERLGLGVAIIAAGGCVDVELVTNPADSCVPLACADVATVECGLVSDGCGGTLDCGTACGDGLLCGAQVANQCGAPCASTGATPQVVSSLELLGGDRLAGFTPTPGPELFWYLTADGAEAASGDPPGRVLAAAVCGSSPRVVRETPADLSERALLLAAGQGRFYFPRFAAAVGVTYEGVETGNVSAGHVDAMVPRESEGVIYGARDGADIFSMPSGGGVRTPLVEGAGFLGRRFVIANERFFWTTKDRQVATAPVSGGEREIITVEEATPIDIAVSGDFLYWITAEGSEHVGLRRAPAAGPGPVNSIGPARAVPFSAVHAVAGRVFVGGPDGLFEVVGEQFVSIADVPVALIESRGDDLLFADVTGEGTAYRLTLP